MIPGKKTLGNVLVGLGGGAVVSQLPQYIAQYEQRLGGAFDEASRNLEQYVDLAKEFGMSLPEYIDRLKINPDEIVSRTGEVISNLSDRVEYLGNSLENLLDASPVGQIGELLTNAEPEIAMATLKAFTPGMPFDTTGITYALVGACAGILGYNLIKYGAKKAIDSMTVPAHA